MSMPPIGIVEFAASLSLGFSAVPFLLGIRNLSLYRPLPPAPSRRVAAISVLIPARNEEYHIRQCIESIRRNEGVDLEVLVWDDASSDGTARIVREIELEDPRVKLMGSGQPPPAGWAGKQHACARLAELAAGEILVFLDADVRLCREDSLARIAGAFDGGRLDFLSGVPMQKTGSWSEHLVVPLIHFVLLGFLPIDGMRRSTKRSFAAGCGQLITCRSSAYRAVGGHATVRASFHEGIGLAREFRSAGRVTDLADFSQIAVCRMYSGFHGVWNGFAKNAHEGLASPSSVVPLSALLVLGQTLPLIALFVLSLSLYSAVCFSGAFLLGMGLRSVFAVRFKHSWMGVLLHPFSVALLLLNQWYGALRHWIGIPIGWRGRTVASCLLLTGFLPSPATAAEKTRDTPVQRCPDFTLEDQNSRLVRIQFPIKKTGLLIIAGRRGTGAIAAWVNAVRTAFGDSVEIIGLADVHSVPGPIKSAVKSMIRKESEWPVLMDWSGSTVSALFSPGLDTEVLVLQKTGEIFARLKGAITPESEAHLQECLRACGAKPRNPPPTH